MLERFCVEPGHPQDIAALSVAIVILLSTQLRTSSGSRWLNPERLVALLAIVVGVVCMTKANIGILLVLGAGSTLLVTAQSNRFIEILQPRALMAGMGIPVLLIAKYWSIQEAVLLPMVTFASLGLVVAVQERANISKCISNRELVTFSGVLISTMLFFVGMAWLSGTSVDGLIHGIVLQHLGFAGSFFSPPPVTVAIIPAVLASGVLALLFLRNQLWVLSLLRFVSIGMLAVLLVQFFFETATPSGGGYEGRLHVQTLMSFGPLFSWVILFPGIRFSQQSIRKNNDDASANSFARVMLCFVSAFQLLICYPIPGSQIAMGTFPLVLVLLIATNDFVETDLRLLWKSQSYVQKRLAIVGLLMGVSIATLLYRDVSLWQRRQSFVALDFPGASFMRLPETKVRQYKQLVEFLRDESDSFIFRESTQNCVYFWAGIDPPTATNATIWPYMLNENQQQRTVDRLEEINRVVVVSTYSNSPLPKNNSPLSDYISENFQPELDVAGFKIWMPKKSVSKSVAVN